MTEVREDLEAFTAELFDGFFRADQRRWGQAYVRGLLLDGRRKSVEPMAARLGEDGNRQALRTSSPPVRGMRPMCGPGWPGGCMKRSVRRH
ncbi:SRSO17 transposase [Streptomyces nodosus]|nr:SRSO17 transposase [Streptomyces nodosus]